MPCASLSAGFVDACLTGIGGALEVFLVNKEDLETGVTIDPTTKEVTALPEVTLYRYRPLKNSINFTETPTPSQENGTFFFAESLGFRIGTLSAAKRLEFNNMARTLVVAFVRLANEKIVMVGYHQGLLLSGGAWQSGAASADFSGYEFTFTGDEPFPAYYLEDFTTTPFDNYADDVTLDPDYSVES